MRCWSCKYNVNWTCKKQVFKDKEEFILIENQIEKKIKQGRHLEDCIYYTSR